MEIERVPNEDGKTEFIKFGQHTHHLPLVPEGMADSEPVQWTETTYTKLCDMIEQAEEINGDGRLSDLGKSERLEPVHAKVHEDIAKLSAALDQYEAGIDAEEAALYALPELHPEATVIGQREVEIRQWFRSLPNKDRMSVMQAVIDGTANREIELALLRSPIALLDQEERILSERWKNRKREENPARIVVIEQKRAAVERSRRAVGMLSATAHSVTRWDQTRIMSRLVRSENEFARKGFKAFGIDEGRFLHAQMAYLSQQRTGRLQ